VLNGRLWRQLDECEVRVTTTELIDVGFRVASQHAMIILVRFHALAAVQNRLQIAAKFSVGMPSTVWRFAFLQRSYVPSITGGKR
jgi:hypothetical protein